MTLRTNLLMATLMAAPLAAQAQPISGVYIRPYVAAATGEIGLVLGG